MTQSGFSAVTVDDGAHTLEVRTTGGRVRAYGVVGEVHGRVLAAIDH